MMKSAIFTANDWQNCFFGDQFFIKFQNKLPLREMAKNIRKTDNCGSVEKFYACVAFTCVITF